VKKKMQMNSIEKVCALARYYKERPQSFAQAHFNRNCDLKARERLGVCCF